VCVLELKVCANEAGILREQAEDFSLVLQVFIHNIYYMGKLVDILLISHMTWYIVTVTSLHNHQYKHPSMLIRVHLSLSEVI
jgi:hypothetical protein